MTKLPLLARIRVATPCQADWAQMTGDERVRHCAHCKKDVFNLSDMSRAQAERLIIERNGDLCARYYQRTDGTILLADCSVGIKKKRKTRVLAAGAAALLAGTGGAAGYLELSHRHAARTPSVEQPVLGRMAVVPAEPPQPLEPPPPPPPLPPDVHETKGQMIELQVPPRQVEVIQGGISMDPREEAIEVDREQAKLKELEAKQTELQRRHAKAHAR